jgi:hypothetical protein
MRSVTLAIAFSAAAHVAAAHVALAHPPAQPEPIREVHILLESDAGLWQPAPLLSALEARGKPEPEPVDPADDCYALNEYRRWHKPVEWSIDRGSVMLAGLDPDQAAALAEIGMASWEEPIRRIIFGDLVDQGRSSIGFQKLSLGVAATTFIWYNSGNGPNRPQHWQMILNLAYPWSVDGDPDAMDFGGIVTHELGHVAGLLHPERIPACTAQTMYPAAIRGDTDMRTLGVGDKRGIAEKY